jgi:hypothetical protein
LLQEDPESTYCCFAERRCHIHGITRQMACFNDAHNWQTIPHRNFSYRYSGLVTKAIDVVPCSLLGDVLTPPSAITLTSQPPALPNPSCGIRQLAYVSCNNSCGPSSAVQLELPLCVVSLRSMPRL